MHVLRVSSKAFLFIFYLFLFFNSSLIFILNFLNFLFFILFYFMT